MSKDERGTEGIKYIPFIVRNGPAISVEGLKKDEIVDGIVPLMINAYGKGDQKSFIIHGSETPQSIPFWILILVLLFIGWAIFYHVTSGSINLF